MLILADRAGLYLSNAFDLIQISCLEQKLCKKNLPRIIINKQRFDFTRTPLALNNSKANNFPIFQARTLKFDMWAFWGIKKFSTTGFFKILSFTPFSPILRPSKITFLGLKSPKMGIFKNPVAKIFFSPPKSPHIKFQGPSLKNREVISF